MEKFKTKNDKDFKYSILKKNTNIRFQNNSISPNKYSSLNTITQIKIDKYDNLPKSLDSSSKLFNLL